MKGEKNASLLLESGASGVKINTRRLLTRYLIRIIAVSMVGEGLRCVRALSLSNMWVSAQSYIMNVARDINRIKGALPLADVSAHRYWLSSEAFCFGAGMRILTSDPREHRVPNTFGQNVPRPVEFAVVWKQAVEVGDGDGVQMVTVPLL